MLCTQLHIVTAVAESHSKAGMIQPKLNQYASVMTVMKEARTLHKGMKAYLPASMLREVVDFYLCLEVHAHGHIGPVDRRH